MTAVPEIDQELNFRYFDDLYRDQEDQYREVLELYMQEYELYRQGVTSTIRSGNSPEFRKYKHKLVYSLHLLGLSQLQGSFEEVAQQLPTYEAPSREETAQLMDEAFLRIMRRIRSKLDNQVMNAGV